LREYTSEPLFDSWKKPLPLIATSSAWFDLASAVQLEDAVTRIRQRAVVRHLVEAVAVDGHVQCRPGRIDRALRELLLHFGQLGADTDLVAHRGRHRIGVHVGELRRAALEANRIRVGDVVADHVEVARRCGQTTQTLLVTHDGLRIWKVVTDRI
jgi:hypothetical protein